MNKVLSRILLFFIGLPAVLALAFWGWGFYFPLTLVAVIASALGTDETAALLRHKGQALGRILPFFLGVVFPSLAYLENARLLTSDQSLTLVSLVIVAISIRQIFANTEENLQPVLGKVAGIVFALIYPGLFLYYLLKINSLPNSLLLTPIFLLATFGNDAWAWMFGTLWGKRSRKPFLVSPSKSLVGFAGGITATFLVFIVSFFLFPGLLGRNFFMILLLSLVFAATTIVGDLFESSLKRSAGVKDSGALIPGRGGVLDSIDSLLFSAPLFYLFLQYGRF
jgi:phosphatidate cytidylyltransferase